MKKHTEFIFVTASSKYNEKQAVAFFFHIDNDM